MVRIPQIKSLETAIRIYYERIEPRTAILGRYLAAWEVKTIWWPETSCERQNEGE